MKKLKQLREAKRLHKSKLQQQMQEAQEVVSMIEEFEIRAKSVKPF